ncbi:hypothetical protein HDU81_008802, partial [Chytriomyces hyalinus]
PIFNGGSTIPPSDGPPPTIMYDVNPYLFTSSGLAILFFSFTILLAACMSLGFIYKNRRKKSVLRTSFAVLFLIVLGMILQGVALLFFIGAPTDFSCRAKAWLQLLAFAIVLPAVTVKSYADYNLVLARKKMNPSTLFSTSIAFMAVAFAAEVGLLLAWSFVGPHSVRTFKGDHYTMGYCLNLTDQNRVGVALHSLNGFLTVVAILFTFRARDAEPLNNESTFPSVVVSTYTLFELTVLSLLEAENPSTKRLVTHAVSIWIISTVTLAFVFVPKMVSIRADNRRVNSELAKILHPSSLRSGSEVGTGKLWRKTSEVKNLAVQRVSDVGRANSGRLSPVHRILASRKQEGPAEKAQLKYHILGKKGVSVLQILGDSTKCVVAESLSSGHTVEISMLLDLTHPLATIPGYKLVMEFDSHEEAGAFHNAYHAFLQTDERSTISEAVQEDSEPKAGIAIRVSVVT